MNDQTSGSVTTLSGLLLAEQGPILAPGDGREAFSSNFELCKGSRKDRKGQNDGELGILGLRGRDVW